MQAASAPLYLSIVLFLISLTQKCYCTTSNCSDSSLVFFIGWLGMFSGGATLTWLANPALLVSWLTFSKSDKTSLFTSVVSTFIALSFLSFSEIVANEGGGHQQIISIKSGYWLWLSSSVVMLGANLYRSFVVMKAVNPIQ